MKEPILKVENLGISFSQYTKGLVRTDLEVIKNLDIELNKGEILAVVGSSGSGKSLLAHAILGILPHNSSTHGRIIYNKEELTEKRKQNLRGREIVLIPQSVNYLDPLKKVGSQIKISIKNNRKSDYFFCKLYKFISGLLNNLNSILGVPIPPEINNLELFSS